MSSCFVVLSKPLGLSGELWVPRQTHRCHFHAGGSCPNQGQSFHSCTGPIPLQLDYLKFSLAKANIKIIYSFVHSSRLLYVVLEQTCTMEISLFHSSSWAEVNITTACWGLLNTRHSRTLYADCLIYWKKTTLECRLCDWTLFIYLKKKQSLREVAPKRQYWLPVGIKLENQ